MQFFLMTEPQLGGGYEQLSWAARYAEDAGLTGFARSDHYYWRAGEPKAATEALTSLGGLARDTSRIRLAVLVSPITFRHPSNLAKSAATLDQMSSGRFDLGLGTGWMEQEHETFGLDFPTWSERFARLEESLGYIRAAFSGEGFEGKYYRLSGEVLPRPSGVRLIVGGSGPEKTPNLAGKYADEYNHFVNSVEVMAPKLEKVKEAALSVGRDPGGITFSVMGPAVLAADRPSLDRQLQTAADLRSISVDELTKRWNTNGVPFGTPDQVAEAIGGLATAGINKYYLQWLDLDDSEGLAGLVDLAAAI